MMSLVLDGNQVSHIPIKSCKIVVLMLDVVDASHPYMALVGGSISLYSYISLEAGSLLMSGIQGTGQV